MAQSEKPAVSVVIPVYNSEATLPTLVARLQASLTASSTTYEIIFINDGSRDSSWSVLSDLAAKTPALVALNLMRNFGQHNALLCGIRRARYPIIVTMDDDLQNPPEEVPKLLAALTDDLDVVYGVPYKQEHHGLRLFLSALVKRALRIAMRVDIAQDVQPFRAFRTKLREAFASHSSTTVNIDVLLSWGTLRFGRVWVEHHPRREGRSNYNFRKLVTHSFNMITGYSTAPLRAASLLGLALTGFGGLLLIFILFKHFFFGGAPQGFAFLASALSLFSGAQLLFLGIIGEYMGRMYNRTMDRPPYVVDKVLTSSPEES